MNQKTYMEILVTPRDFGSLCFYFRGYWGKKTKNMKQPPIEPVMNKGRNHRYHICELMNTLNMRKNHIYLGN